MADQYSSGIPWHDIVAAVVRRRKLLLAVFACGMALAVALAFVESPIYDATAKLMVTSERARITVSPDPKSGPTVDRVTDQDLNSEVALLQSSALLREVLEPYRDQIDQEQPTSVVRNVGQLLRYPLEIPARLYGLAHNVTPLTPYERWVQSVAAHVTVTPIKGSNLLAVSFSGSRPEWCAAFINQLATHHVERHARLNQQSEALEFLEGQRQLLGKKLREAEGALADFYDREGMDAATEQRSVLRSRLAKLESTLAKSTTELAEAAARAEFLRHDIQLRSQNAAVEPQLAGADPLQLVRSRILELQLQRSDLLSKFAPASLRVQSVDKQIEEAQRLLATEEAKRGGRAGNPTLALDLSRTDEQIAAVKARVQALTAQIAEYRGKLDHLDQVAPQLGRLEQEVATAKESFLTYGKKVEEARFSDALDQSRIVNVSIVEPAQIPPAPRPSKRPMTLFLGAIMSLCAGAGLAVLLDRLDPAVKSADEAERISELTILADIPS